MSDMGDRNQFPEDQTADDRSSLVKDELNPAPRYLSLTEIKTGTTDGYRETVVQLLPGSEPGILRYKAPSADLMISSQALADERGGDSTLKQTSFMIKVLSNCIVDEEGKPMFTEESMGEVAFDVLESLLRTVTGDITGKKSSPTPPQSSSSTDSVESSESGT